MDLTMRMELQCCKKLRSPFLELPNIAQEERCLLRLSLKKHSEWGECSLMLSNKKVQMNPNISKEDHNPSCGSYLGIQFFTHVEYPFSLYLFHLKQKVSIWCNKSNLTKHNYPWNQFIWLVISVSTICCRFSRNLAKMF